MCQIRKKLIYEKGGSKLFLKWCKEEKCEDNGTVFRNTYLANYWADFLQIWYVCVYRGHKICKLNRNWPTNYRENEDEDGGLAIPVNNTLVCLMAFLATDTQPCDLIMAKPSETNIIELYKMIDCSYKLSI